MSGKANTPILIGVGQVVAHWEGEDMTRAPSPDGLRLEAARRALADAGPADRIGHAIDRVVVVRTMLDSTPAPQPFGRTENPPGALADDLGIAPTRLIYSAVGGDQPQALVNEAAEAIFADEADAILIAGAEATAAMKVAAKLRLALDWARPITSPLEDRGPGAPLLSAYEVANGLGMPTQTYPAFEHALRARLGLTREEHLALMSELWAGFCAVAATNPYAQFPQPRTASFLATPGRDNYPVADPYLKWHVAQDAVNQGAALIVTSAARATELGVDPARWIYLHGYAQAADATPTARPDLSRSRAVEGVLRQTLASAGKAAADIGHFDLYSCFPCAVLLAAEALGLDWRTPPATVTGGLPFFGGAGNNYSTHAIATMVERLRVDRAGFGLVLANGGFLSKEAAGVYSAQAPAEWQPISSAAIQQAIDDEPGPALLAETTEATVETYTVTYSRGVPTRGYVVARTPRGRILARARSGHRATLAALAAADPVGQRIKISHENGVNMIDAAAPIGAPTRPFEHVLVERRGHVLEVTIDRPEAMNALHSAAHFELHEIWDAFERDPDLWVGIVTGAGDRAFSAGNDLKVTAQGGDMSLPSTGFGGLCARFDRLKPVIAAVNGIAMGGGLEIALACDLIVADERARMALPEVRVGLFAGAGGVQRLTRQIGRKAAMALILTGRHIDAAEALAAGIVNRVVPAGTALEAARALADEIMRNAPSAVQASRAALNKLDEIERLKEAIEANGPIFATLLGTDDFREGVAAFAQKRPPHWTGT